MIATITFPTISKLREARMSLIARNVLPIEELDGTFTGYLGILGLRYWNLFTEKQDAPFIILGNLKLYKSSAVSGAVIWGRRPNPNQMVLL